MNKLPIYAMKYRHNVRKAIIRKEDKLKPVKFEPAGLNLTFLSTSNNSETLKCLLARCCFGVVRASL